VKSRGSRPRSISTERKAPIMLVSTIRAIASALASTSWPSRSASRPSAARAAAVSSCMRPPRKLSGLIRPSTRLASVTVASVPPRP